MLVDIIRMPPHLAPYLDRRTDIHWDGLYSLIGLNSERQWDRPVSGGAMFGACISRYPEEVYKAIYLARDGHAAFEVAFGRQNHVLRCYYVKIIEYTVRFGVSVQAVRDLSASTTKLLTLPELVVSLSRRPSAAVYAKALSPIAAPIFDRLHLAHEISELANPHQGIWNKGKTDQDDYRPVYTHIPHVMEALVTGTFCKNPFSEIRAHVPHVRFDAGKWFGVQKYSFASHVQCTDLNINHPEMDAIVHQIMTLRPGVFKVRTSFNHALEGIVDLAVIESIADPYVMVLPMSSSQSEKSLKTLRDILFKIIEVYCQIYDIGAWEIDEANGRISTISIEKNLYDEVIIHVIDTAHNINTMFYTYFPTIALTSFSVACLSSRR